jgi:hypothetical protein
MAPRITVKLANGKFPAVFRKASQILNKEIFLVNNSPIDWEKLKVDLERLSKPQLDLVVRLIENMKIVNQADKKEANPSRN